MVRHSLIVFIVVCCSAVAMVSGRGRLIDPPNRSSLWRKSRVFPVNRNDSDLNCRGDLIPFMPEMENWCGACGDPIFGPRNHELYGKYVPRYFVSRTYRTRYIPVSVLVETFKGGYFEFSLCPLNFARRRINSECFREYRMQIRGVGRRYFPYTTGIHRMMLVVPEEFTCRHCVLQWRWVTEQNLPPLRCMTFPVSRACLAPQEYRNCADIHIGTPLPNPYQMLLRLLTS